MLLTIFNLVCWLSLTVPKASMDVPQFMPPQMDSNFPPITQVEQPSDRIKGAQRYRLTDLAVLENAFNGRVSNLQVLVQGRVIAVLSNDTMGDRHQRFIIELANAQTLLVAHNIDVAPRVERLRVGDRVVVFGEYEWNERGGTVHWTHHDPDGSHVGGWIDHNGLRYE